MRPLLAIVLLTGCAGQRAASAEQLAAAEAGLRAPFQEPRAVVADQITIDVSANFDDEVARPATNPELHTLQRGKDSGDDLCRWISQGGTQMPLRFTIGGLSLAALQGATLRVRGSGKELALTVIAGGNVIERAGGASRPWRELRIEHGRIARR